MPSGVLTGLQGVVHAHAHVLVAKFKTDAALRHALQDETRDAAVLIIAQRISTILHADQIVVLKDGEIVGLGTHDELMETCEVYRAIAESQMKGGE